MNIFVLNTLSALAAVTIPAGLETTINNMISGLQGIGACVVLYQIVNAGMAIAHGDDEHKQAGKKKLIGCAIAIVVIMGAFVIKDWITSMTAFS